MINGTRRKSLILCIFGAVVMILLLMGKVLGVVYGPVKSDTTRHHCFGVVLQAEMGSIEIHVSAIRIARYFCIDIGIALATF